MKNAVLLVALLLALSFAAGCKSADTGNREFIPGKGWVPA
jgi:hypothetical protein